MPRWTSSSSALIAAVVAGVAVFGMLAFVLALGPCGATRWSSLGVAITSGMLTGVTALVLLGSRPVGHAGTETPEPTSCVACGASLVEEWRLCPHCGQMRECDTRHPVETAEDLRT